MAPTMKELGIDRLNIEDRLTLIEEIWSSISTDPQDFPLDDQQKRELDNRIADLDRTPNDVVTWDSIKSGVRSSP